MLHGLLELLLPAISDRGCHEGGVEEYAQERESGGWAFFLLLFCWGANSVAQSVHGLHVALAGIRFRRPSGEEIIQVVDEMGYPIPVVEDPLDGCGQVVEEGWGGAETKR